MGISFDSSGCAIIADFFQWSGQARAVQQFDKTASTVLANIPGLSVNVSSGKTYTFQAILYVTSGASSGAQVAISGTATATSIVYEGLHTSNATIKAQTRATALGTSVAGNTTGTNPKIEITGTITVANAGTLTVQFAQNAASGTSSVLVGSVFTVHQLG